MSEVDELRARIVRHVEYEMRLERTIGSLERSVGELKKEVDAVRGELGELRGRLVDVQREALASYGAVGERISKEVDMEVRSVKSDVYAELWRTSGYLQDDMEELRALFEALADSIVGVAEEERRTDG